MSDSDPRFNPLSGTNYPQWSGEMQCPVTDAEAQEKWELRAEKAAGALYLNVTKEQCIHLDGIIDDPVKIWEKLATVHMSGTRFNAYDNLFSIRKKGDESLQSLMTRIDEGMHQIQNLCPTGFTLAKLDNELTCMAIIRVLPDEYAHFTSSLLLLGSLDKTQLRYAFLAEEINCCCCAKVDSALHSSSTKKILVVNSLP
ncbi:hypothetical protein SERLA73DRAFT_68261 [Serpula lacrymans var. lacrymans S7.3]|uniref:Retrotransposon Copia-like N-terminal domain-containing protein n=2 Tax=Serpula lacrymans var. lacrymans TaxID=341189 RepID=F8PHU5_SERL3|nr:uncharacterized protein SERLADRAFT_432003 [Serpula lacrymans var. lacrymans S7.9]EGO04574.1 hypothetical protein SERLA73DRAFT_68261 [Serpula lacrymans var. lacrymans S7.3]EGO30449.1 hypothetical protein SERLADRAFT_432003 [Serpula lacrymans var. lacrymans S7.9]